VGKALELLCCCSVLFVVVRACMAGYVLVRVERVQKLTHVTA
jgi:hypothetical protein